MDDSVEIETQSEEFAEFLKDYARQNGFPEPIVEVYKPSKEELSSKEIEEEDR